MLSTLRHQYNDCTFLFQPLPRNTSYYSVDGTILAASQLLLNSILTLKNKAKLHLHKAYVIRTRSFTKQYFYRESKHYLSKSFFFVWRQGRFKRGSLKQMERNHPMSIATFRTNLTSQTQGRKHTEECCPAFC